jgi:membrane-associated phospholipid phosphatase
MRSRISILSATLVIASGCHDGPTDTSRPLAADAVRGTALHASANDASSTSSVRWNRMSVALFRARGNPNAGRTAAYLSLAQYRAVLAAQDDRHGRSRPSLAGAAAGASVVVLKDSYPLDAAAIDAALAAQRAESPLGTEINKDFAAGEAIGREVAAAVLAWAASDNFGLTSPGVPPVGPGYWVSSGAPIVRGGLGARPFFLTSGSELRLLLPPPPAFGSADYLAALAEVRAISDGPRTEEQLAIARKWAPFAGPVWNGIATDLLEKYHKSELESARILAYANAAEFDAIIACFDVKFVYWFIRPAQADKAITLPIGMPNHPSYPSAHSCGTGAWQGVLTDAFPSERAMLADLAQEAGMSRVYAGIHYRFDFEAGQVLGRAAARLALERRGLE